MTPNAVSVTPSRRSPIATPQLQDLLDAVAAVALKAADGDREAAVKLTRKAWVTAARLAEHSEIPSPQAICERLHLSWSRVLELSLSEPAERPKIAASWDGSLGSPLGEEGRELALQALRSVAHQLQTVPTMGQFDEKVAAMEAGNRKRRGAVRLRLPRAVYLVKAFGSWEGALVAAGLQKGRSRRRRPTPPMLETVHLCVNEIGMIPTRGYFVRWARLKDIPLPPEYGWLEIAYQLRSQREALKLPQVPRATRFNDCPPLPPPATGRLRRPWKVTKEQALDSLRRYKATHHDGSRFLTQKGYLEACRKDPDLIWPSSLGQFGTWHDLCQEAGI